MVWFEFRLDVAFNLGSFFLPSLGPDGPYAQGLFKTIELITSTDKINVHSVRWSTRRDQAHRNSAQVNFILRPQWAREIYIIINDVRVHWLICLMYNNIVAITIDPTNEVCMERIRSERLRSLKVCLTILYGRVTRIYFGGGFKRKMYHQLPTINWEIRIFNGKTKISGGGSPYSMDLPPGYMPVSVSKLVRIAMEITCVQRALHRQLARHKCEGKYNPPPLRKYLCCACV